MATYQALLHRFTVVCDEPSAAAYLEQVLAPLRASDDGTQPVTRYQLTRSAGSAVLDQLSIDGRPVRVSSRSTGAISALLARIDRDAEVVTGREHTVLHAAACHLDGRTLLLPGAPNAGKSTLVASLALYGWTYLSDELVAILPDTPPRLLVYPRTAVLDPGSWPLFDGQLIEPPSELISQLPERRHVHLPAGRAAGPASTQVVTDVLLYRWQADAAPEIEPLDPVAALRALLGSSFSVRAQPERDLARLSNVIDHAECWAGGGHDPATMARALRARLERIPR